MYSKHFGTWIKSDPQPGLLQLKSVTSLLENHFEFQAEKLAHILASKNRKTNAPLSPQKTQSFTSAQDYLDAWQESANQGTLMHSRFELLVNLCEYERAIIEQQLNFHVPIAPTFPEKVHFHQFLEAFALDMSPSRYMFCRSEMKLAHDLLHITGTVDVLLYDTETDSYVIVDWKRCKNGVKKDPRVPKEGILSLSPNSRAQGSVVYESVRNTKINKYGCQLTLYKFLFEYMTGKVVSALYLAVVDSLRIGEQDAFQLHMIPMDQYEQCIRDTIAIRIEQLRNDLQSLGCSEPYSKQRQLFEEQLGLYSTRIGF